RDLIQEEFNVKSFLRIEAKSNTTLQKEIEVVNYLPQNSFLTILNKNKNIQTKGNKIELKSRKKNNLNLNVEIKSGVNNYKLILENFNNKKRRLNIETIGWDILASEFINESELKKSNCIAFNKGENIYIQSVENSKLLKIKRRKKIIEIPFSKAINKINTDSLKKGKYILEIINLGKNTSKFCKIKIK
ncbi:MAG: hypothetical protein ACPG5P_05135, partial [Saprospiraceae bacterium]